MTEEMIQVKLKESFFKFIEECKQYGYVIRTIEECSWCEPEFEITDSYTKVNGEWQRVITL